MNISNFTLDWLSFTYLRNKTGNLIEDFFSDFPELDQIKSYCEVKSGSYYANSLYLDEYMQILFDNDDTTGKGVNVRISSHGLDRFFQFFGVTDVPSMFRILRDRGCRPSRIDLAFDDFTKQYSPQYYEAKWLNGRIFTRMKQHSFMTNPENGGNTFYLGSRRKKMVRIYDKSLESSGVIDAVRYEIEMHCDSAISFFNYLIDIDSEDEISFGCLIYDIFRVVNPNPNDKTKSRWPVNKRWYAFMESQLLRRDTVKIPKYKPEVIVAKIEKWVKNECFGALQFFSCLYGPNWLKTQLEKVNLPTRYKLLLSDLRSSWFEHENFEDSYNRLFMI